MYLKTLFLAGLVSALGLSSVSAQPQRNDRRENTCLMSARISGYDAVDNRTLIVTDTSHNRYRVRLAGVCQGLTNPRMAISLRASSRLTCIGIGDRVAFRDSAFGRQSCSVRSVERIGNRDRDRDRDRRDRDRYDRDNDHR